MQKSGESLMQRVENLQKDIESAYLDAFLVTDSVNIYYLTGFKLIQGDGCLLIYSQKGYLITDDRYEEAVTESNISGTVGCITRDYYGEVNRLCHKLNISVLGIESNISYKIYDLLDETFDADIVPIDNFIEDKRSIKDPSEIKKLKNAAELNQKGFDYICETIKPGMTEVDIANMLDWWMKRNGATKASFDTIVASGANAAKPHALSTKKQITVGEPIIIDFGYFVDGYTADLTRTIMLGNQSAKFNQLYQIVYQAREAVINAASNGIVGKSLDKVGRDIINDAGYGQYFNHGMGHGIGLEVHEIPTSYGTLTKDTLKTNQVVTVEPGIYLPGEGGIRVEDDILITDGAAQQISNAPDNLIIL
ncbi:Xaa-Pro aminopeptidase [Paucilactobacillus suebicus DSM 5007 = KCTC 3549]|uniref:Xaa-Pro aminopeptidase n=2 Tax=Paucilactobacillus suebicus TaxID=152335 RepID=A0A0R1W687_9LACO|nr:Xaa-Pro aminopeptidase [Paucilactobacillus suebicus DSM 5007 = KCTC 3549]